jgi:anti-anti-sigma factor
MSEPQYQYVRPELQQGVLVLTITQKELQGDDAAIELRKEMHEAAEQFQAGNVVVDFQNTEYLSSAAFWPLLSLWRRVREKGGRVILCGLRPLVGDVFFTTKLVSRDGSFEAPFGVETDVAAGVRRASEPPAK